MVTLHLISFIVWNYINQSFQPRDLVCFVSSFILGYSLTSSASKVVQHLRHLFGYLKNTAKLCLSSNINVNNQNLSTNIAKQQDCGNTENNNWEFYVDTDFAANTDPSNKRRSQIGYIALINSSFE